MTRNPREYGDEYPAVLYYYALEEFGKALYLKDLKEKNENGKFIDVDLYDHNVKINKALEHNPELKIRKLEDTGEIFPPKEVKETLIFNQGKTYKNSDYNIIESFFERTQLSF